jgi:hypothetical protein
LFVNEALLFDGKNTVEAKVWLHKKQYSDSAPAKSIVEKWFAKFKRGEMTIEDNGRSGLPKEAVTDKNIKNMGLKRYQRNVLGILCMNI